MELAEAIAPADRRPGLLARLHREGRMSPLVVLVSAPGLGKTPLALEGRKPEEWLDLPVSFYREANVKIE